MCAIVVNLTTLRILNLLLKHIRVLIATASAKYNKGIRTLYALAIMLKNASIVTVSLLLVVVHADVWMYQGVYSDNECGTPVYMMKYKTDTCIKMYDNRYVMYNYNDFMYTLYSTPLCAKSKAHVRLRTTPQCTKVEGVEFYWKTGYSKVVREVVGDDSIAIDYYDARYNCTDNGHYKSISARINIIFPRPMKRYPDAAKYRCIENGEQHKVIEMYYISEDVEGANAYGSIYDRDSEHCRLVDGEMMMVRFCNNNDRNPYATAVILYVIMMCAVIMWLLLMIYTQKRKSANKVIAELSSLV